MVNHSRYLNEINLWKDFMINEKFEEWACSLSGCDGGNPDASTWLCGIEWGGGGESDEQNEKYYGTTLPREIAEGRVEANSEYNWQHEQKYPYGKSVAKLYAAYRGHKIDDYENFLKSLDNSELYKLNLYPIAFQHTGYDLWTKYGMETVTGLQSKELYRIWCFFNRFPEFAKRVHHHRPELIICTGVTYLIDFFACFAGNSDLASQIQVDEIEPISPTNRRSNRKYYWVKLKSGTTLAVIPFFSGSNGLNSFYLLEQMGIRLRNIVANNRA